MRKKNLTRILSAAAALLVSMLLLTLNTSANDEDHLQYCCLYDENDIIDEADEAELDKTIRQTAQDTNQYVAVVIYGPDSPAYSDSQVEQMADSHYLTLFEPQTETDADGLLLILNLSTHYAYITTSGTGQLYYSNSSSDNRIDRMIDNMKSDLRSEDYAGAVRRFCSDVRHYHDIGIKNGAYSYDSSMKKYYWYENGELVSGKKLPLFYGKDWEAIIRFGLIIGAIAGIITALIIRSRYKLVKSLSATNYISRNDTNFYEKNDLFLRTHTSKTRISSESSGGGGGGSSHSSGGHSFGGGGGHW